MKKYKFDISILGGLGHVGLPLGIMFAEKKLKVLLYDTNLHSLEIVKKKVMPFTEYGAEELLKKNLNKNLFLSSNYDDLFLSKNIIITIGTPIDEYLNPKINNFLSIFKKIRIKLKSDQNVIVRSSVYPGTMNKIYQILKSKNKNLSYCPERIVQGYAIQELKKLPQIISGYNKKSERIAAYIFSKISKKNIICSIEEAELAKLISNSWRYIQFAAANQFYMICNSNNLDFNKIRKVMTDSYPRGSGLPGAGFAAGPCLLKDTMQLYSYSKNIFSMGSSAMLINEGMPAFIIDKLKKSFNLKNYKIGILGMSFKANIDDSRDSLSFKIKKLLIHEAKKVFCSDEFIKNKEYISKYDLIKKSDIIIVATPHDNYQKLNISKNKIIIDIWNIFKK